MIKVKVTHEFIDRHTNELHPQGAVFSVNEERFEEIKNAGDFVEVISEEVISEEVIQEQKPRRNRKAGKKS